MAKFLKPLGIAALLVSLAVPQTAMAQNYVSHFDAIEKLVAISPACTQVASYYVPNSNCETQTYLVSFIDDRAQDLVGAQNSESLEQTLELASVSAFELNGFELANMVRNRSVVSVSQDISLSIANTQANAPWQLDRLDQQDLPLNQTHNFPSNAQGLGVRVYIVDTGINPDHAEFTGRIIAGYNTVGSNTGDTLDCNGHGTHVTGLAAGTTYGAAKLATIVPVRVLGCEGTGTLRGVLTGLDWIANNTRVGQPAVVNMSLGGETNNFLDNAVTSLTNQGLAFVVAAGNSSVTACNTSPARVPGAITVAASSRSDGWASFSNFGSCVDIVAPGVGLASAWIGPPSATAIADGTSMAAGVVSGIIANQMSFGYQSPDSLTSAITSLAANGKITGVPAGTPNLLLQNTIAFSASGSSIGSQTPIVVPNDNQDSVGIDPITSPPSPGATSQIPTRYSQPAVQVVEKAATASWQIPAATTPLSGQVIRLLTGTTLVASYQISASVTSFSLTELVAGVIYRIQVAGMNQNGVGELSDFSASFTLAGSLIAGPSGGELSAWTKLISKNQVKFYVKYPQLGQKIQFMLQQRNGQYREIGWIRIEQSDLDGLGQYRNLTNKIYFIRTINLAPGKNRLRILVDSNQIAPTVTYAR
jgi:subtilisin family serine protease